MTPQHFMQFAEPLPEPTLLLLANGKILAANRAAGDRLGIGRAEIDNRPLTDLVLESAEQVERYLRNCSRSRTMVLGSLTIRCVKGEPLACRAEGAVVAPRDKDQEAVLILRLLPKTSTIGQFLGLNEQIGKLGKEILRRKHTEEELRRQKEWLQVTLKSIGDAVIATSAQGDIVFINPVAQSFLGYSEEEAVGRPLNEIFLIVNEHSRQPVDNPVSAVIRQGKIVGLANHTILIDRNGRERPIEDTAAPINDQQGRLVGVILVFHDVTQQRQAERELRNADRRKDEFLATLAHELRNPLAPLRNALEILKRSAGSGDEFVRDAQATMDRQLSQMVRLIDDLLDVSRISRGKLELRRQAVDLSSILHQALETCRPLIESLRHKVAVDLPPSPIYVEGDPVRLCQVFTNLINNACKFTEPAGRIELIVDRRSEEVDISVKDSGLGIPADHLQSIFEMFSQVDSSLARSHGGLGIGLTLVKQVVELHHGSVEARSPGHGHGSEFLVRLPILTGSPPAAVLNKPAEQASENRYCILVVDDNRDSAATLATLLKLSGHKTQTAFDGPDAITAAEELRPDVIVLDIGLPKMNGYDVCRAIRKETWGKKTVILALTGWGQEEDRRKSAEAGFDGHLVKPVELADLKKLLEKLPSSRQ